MSARPALFFALLLLAGCASATPNPALPEGRVALRLLRADGEHFSLASVRGKVAVVSVFATSSDPALVELKLFEELKNRYGGDLVIVCAVVETDLRMVGIFEETFGVPFVVGMVEDPATFTSERGPFGPITMDPTSVLLDAEGRIAARMDGLWPPGLLAKAVGELLHQKVAGGSGDP